MVRPLSRIRLLAERAAAPLRFVTPFHYYTPGDALAHGTVPWLSLAVLTAVGVTGLAAADEQPLAGGRTATRHPLPG